MPRKPREPKQDFFPIVRKFLELVQLKVPFQGKVIGDFNTALGNPPFRSGGSNDFWEFRRKYNLCSRQALLFGTENHIITAVPGERGSTWEDTLYILKPLTLSIVERATAEYVLGDIPTRLQARMKSFSDDYMANLINNNLSSKDKAKAEATVQVGNEVIEQIETMLLDSEFRINQQTDERLAKLQAFEERQQLMDENERLKAQLKGLPPTGVKEDQRAVQ
jgi:hypothetical protein